MSAPGILSTGLSTSPDHSLRLQLEVAHHDEANEALAVDPREVSVVVKVMAIIRLMMANTPRRRMRGNCGVNMLS